MADNGVDVLYARVSTDRQERDETIETQIAEIERFCAGAGILLSERFLDDGISGRLPFDQRPEGSRLLQWAAAGRIRHIVTYKTDRLGRDAPEILSTLARLRRMGVRVLYARERFEDSPVGRFSQGVMSLVAELGWENIRENTMAGLRRAAAEGRWVSGPVPYGYALDEARHLQLDERPIEGTEYTPARVVRLCFRMVADERLSSWDVADRLNALGIPTQVIAPGRRRAVLWRHTRISRIIRATVYRGLHTYHAHEGPVDRVVPALVDCGTWERANAQLKANRRRAPGNTRHQYLLRGLLRCGVCGLAYHGWTSVQPRYGEWSYYLCWARDARPENAHRGKCTSPRVRADWLEADVWAALVRRLEHPEEAVEELRAELQRDREDLAELAGERARLQELRAGKASEVQEILTWYRQGRIDRDAADQQLEQIQRETAALDAQLRAMAERQRAAMASEERIDSAAAILTRLQGALPLVQNFDDKRALVEEMVRQVTILPDGRAHIIWRY